MGSKPLQGKRLSDISISKTWNVNGRHLVAPIAAFSMACLLFVYTRSSIYAAKRNAKRYREADGGQISWYNESQRRHGSLQKPEETNTLKQMVINTDRNGQQTAVRHDRMSEREDLLRARKAESKSNER